MLQYLYLLDYNPTPQAQVAPSVSSKDHDSDTASTKTDAIQYGQVYGAAAISAFGGLRESMQGLSPYLDPFHHRNESQLTLHAAPGMADFSVLQQQRERASLRSVRSAGPPEPSHFASPEPNLVLHARVYAAAGYYGLGGMKALALEKLRIQLTRHWDSVEFAEAINVIYTSTPNTDKDIRECVADTIEWHRSLLSKPEVEIAIMDINGLAYELLKRSRRSDAEFMNR